MAIYQGTFSARPYRLRVIVTEDAVEAANNRSRYRIEVDVVSNTGYGSYRYDPFTAIVHIAGNDTNLTRSSGLQFGPSGDYSGKTLAVGSFVTGWINHDSSGNLQFAVRVRSSGSYGVFGSADSGTQTHHANRIAITPGVPPAPVIQGYGVADVTYSISAPSSNGGSPITTYQHQVSTDSSFASVVQEWSSPSSSQLASGLAPGTSFWIRYRAVNAVGPGGWSPSASVSTLASSAPGLSVSTSLAGTAATVTLSPPGGGAPVTKYRVERRPLSGSAVSSDTTANILNVTGLTPGSVYEWRASAFYGDYQTPWSTWLPIIQPNPNVNPGDYFDGSTPPADGVSYAWDGAPHSSASYALGLRPKGWSVTSGDSGATALMYQVTGGRSGAKAAQVIIMLPSSAPGLHAGIEATSPGAFEVEPVAGYSALIHVQIPDRSQRMAAMIVWLDSDDNEVGRVVGEASVVPSGASAWTPLRVSGVSPVGADYGAVRVIDVAGPGWESWRIGDTFIIDDAITPSDAYYFDGDTPGSGRYDYEWEGAPGESVSVRVESTDPEPDPLADPNCPPIPSPPRAPLVEEICVGEPSDQWRRIWVEVEADRISTASWSVPIVKIHTSQPIDSMRIRYFPNPFNRPLNLLEADSFCAEQNISYLPGQATLTIDGVAERVWVEIEGNPETLAADHLMRGRDGDSWPLLGCGSGGYIVVDIPVGLPWDAVRVEYAIIQRY